MWLSLVSQMDMRGMTAQFPPASLQTQEVSAPPPFPPPLHGMIAILTSVIQAREQTIPLERAGNPQEIARVAGFLASGFSSYVNGANLVVDGGAS